VQPTDEDPWVRPKPMDDLQIYENLMTDINRTNWGGTNVYAFTHDTRAGTGWNFHHNTILNTDSNGLYTPEGAMALGPFTFQNNIARKASLGLKTGGVGEGTATLDAQFPSYTWGGNVIAGATCNLYPAGTTCPTQTNFEAAFTSYGTGAEDVILNYALATGHAYNTAGTDGGRVGADVAALAVMLANVQFGNVPAAVLPVPRRSRSIRVADEDEF
jgi:hypothetical protein